MMGIQIFWVHDSTTIVSYVLYVINDVIRDSVTNKESCLFSTLNPYSMYITNNASKITNQNSVSVSTDGA